MAGKVIILAGARGEGKSTLVKHFLSQVREDQRLVFDVQNEYRDYVNQEELPEFDEFIAMSNLCNYKVIVYEEATAFLYGRIGLQMRKVLVNSRHKHNTIILVFHALSMIPKDIVLLGNYLILRPTGDNPKDVHTRFGLTKISEAVSNAKNLPEFIWEEGKIPDHITVEYL